MTALRRRLLPWVVVLLMGAGYGVAVLSPAAAAEVGGPSKFVPTGPTRVFDTRTGLNVPEAKVPGKGSVVVRLLGRAGVPASGVSAVVLNVGTTETGRAGFVQVFPTGRSTPGAFSNVNVARARQTIAGLVTAPLGDGGTVTVFTDGGGHLFADVLGYYATSGASADGRFQSLAPARTLDTRTGLGTPAPTHPGDVRDCGDFATWAAANDYFWTYLPSYGDVARLDSDDDQVPCEGLAGAPATARRPAPPKPGAAGTVTVQVTGRGGVPATGVRAVALNITAVQASANGYVQAVATGGSTALGATSNLNVDAGRTVANLVTVPVGAQGRVTLYTSGGAHLLADVAGYFTDGTAPVVTQGLFQALEPRRLWDSRSGGADRLAARGQTALSPLGQVGIPTTNVSGLVLNAISVSATTTSFLQVLPTGQVTAGAASNVNTPRAGEAIANSVLTRLGTGDQVSVYVSHAMHAVLDVFGYYLGSAPVAPTAPAGGGAAALDGLVIAPANTTVAYSRASWVHWIDADGDCQSTRAEVLVVESRQPVSPAGGCTVTSGDWYDPYSGQRWTLASDLDVDHFVPLANAHASGGHAWDAARKQAYANDLRDPIHLIAVEDGLNQAKGASGPESWRPPRTAFWCDYAGAGPA